MLPDCRAREVMLQALRLCCEQKRLPFQVGDLGQVLQQMHPGFSKKYLPCKLGQACAVLAGEGLLQLRRSGDALFITAMDV